jgi:hypothetical protein
MLGGFLGSDTGTPAPMTAEIATGEDFRRATEEVLRRRAETRPSLYHLVLDSTAIPIDACVELIALATRSLIRA